MSTSAVVLTSAPVSTSQELQNRNLKDVGTIMRIYRDILMSKARKMTILTITMFNENVHTGCLFLNGKKSRHSLNGWGGVGVFLSGSPTD